MKSLRPFICRVGEQLAASSSSVRTRLVDIEQLVNIIYDYYFLAAALAGFGHHIRYVQPAELEKLAKVC